MVSDLLAHALLLLALLWLVRLSSWAWPRGHTTMDSAGHTPAQRATRRVPDPQPFAGLTTKPLGTACTHGAVPRYQLPAVPPLQLRFT